MRMPGVRIRNLGRASEPGSDARHEPNTLRRLFIPLDLYTAPVPLRGSCNDRTRRARLRIELREIEPRLWRRVDVPLSSTLLALHDIIQIAVGWTDSHLFEFVIGDRVYGEPMPDDDFWDRHVYKAAGIRLKTLIDCGVERFLYVYDFGDDWRHDVLIESVGDGRPTPTPQRSSSASGGARRRTSAESPASWSFLRRRSIRSTWSTTRLVNRYGKPFDPVDIDERCVRLRFVVVDHTVRPTPAVPSREGTPAGHDQLRCPARNPPGRPDQNGPRCARFPASLRNRPEPTRVQFPSDLSDR